MGAQPVRTGNSLSLLGGEITQLRPIVTSALQRDEPGPACSVATCRRREAVDAERRAGTGGVRNTGLASPAAYGLLDLSGRTTRDSSYGSAAGA